MKRWHYIVLAGLGILAAIYVYLHREDLGLAGTHGFGAAEVAGRDQAASSSHPARMVWQTVDRSADGFRVEMPSDVKEMQIPAYNEAGGTDQVNMIFANPSADTTFSVAWADNPPVVRANARNPDRTLDMARDEALARTQTSLVRETRNTLGGFPGRLIDAHNAGGGVLSTQLIYVGPRLYMLTAVFPSSGARRDQDVSRFFNSFKTQESPRIPETMPLASSPAQRD